MQDVTSTIHAIPVDPLTGAISVPIYQTSTFEQAAPGENQGYAYSRSANPTRQVLEDLIASLESGHQGFAFGSGLAAVDGVVKLLKAGDEIVAPRNIYGGTFRMFNTVYNKFDITVNYVDTTDLGAILNAVNPHTALVWLESPTNPTLELADIAAISRIAHNHGAKVVVDNTFATPALQKPLELGADIVVHSATKYLGGHCDVIAGLVVASDPEVCEELKYHQNATGNVLGPWDSWLTIRGIETLHLRVDRHSDTALEVARRLEQLPQVAKVHYPGLRSHPQYHLGRAQQIKGGGIVSFSLKENTTEAALKVIAAFKLFKLAESLGGVKSLVSHPATMTHKTLPEAARHAAGIPDSLIRLSVGLEAADDLVDDIVTAVCAAADISTVIAS